VTPGVSKAALCRAGSGDADIFASGSCIHDADNSSQRRNHLAASGVDRGPPTGGFRRRL